MNYQEVTEQLVKDIMNGREKALIPNGLSGLWELKLPTPQRSGTEFQKLTYARIKAREMVDKLKVLNSKVSTRLCESK